MNTRILVPNLAALLGLVLLTCHGVAADGRQKSRFAGTYSGKFTTTDNQEGVVTVTVDDKGNITGESTNTTLDQTAKLSGTVDDDGRGKIVFEFPTATYTASGVSSKTAKGTIIGIMIQRSGMRAMGAIEFELIPKS